MEEVGRKKETKIRKKGEGEWKIINIFLKPSRLLMTKATYLSLNTSSPNNTEQGGEVYMYYILHIIYNDVNAIPQHMKHISHISNTLCTISKWKCSIFTVS